MASPVLEKRILAAAIDYIIMCLLAVPFLAFNQIIWACIIIYPLAINKDFLNGKSIGKRIVGIQVQNHNQNTANQWRCAFRNLLPIIPFEPFFLLFSPQKRVGDRLANTQVGLENQLTIKTIPNELRNFKLNKELIFGIAYGFANIYALLMLYSYLFSLA